LKTAADNIKSGQVVDESIPEPPIPDEDDDYEPDDCHSMSTPVILALLRPQSFHLWCLKSPQLSKQAQKMQHRQAHTYQVASNHSTSIRQTHTNTTNQYNGHLNVHSPTYQQTNIQRAPTFGFEPFRQFAHLSAEHGMGAEHQSDRTTRTHTHTPPATTEPLSNTTTQEAPTTQQASVPVIEIAEHDTTPAELRTQGGDMVPQTPPEARSSFFKRNVSAADLPPDRPEKSPFETMIASSTTMQRVDNFHIIHNYDNILLNIQDYRILQI